MGYNESDVRAGAEKMFFKAMQAGYAAEGTDHWETEKLGGLGGILANHTTFSGNCEEGPWIVQDRWVRGDNGYTSGWTLIAYQHSPVWHMQYWGRYAKEAIPFLKAALRKNYENNLFVGGRGPRMFTDEIGSLKLGYANGVEEESFSSFSGVESIVTFNQAGFIYRILGYHRYQGGYLF